MSREHDSTTMTPPPNPAERAVPADSREQKARQAQPALQGPALGARRKGGFHFHAAVGRFEDAADRVEDA